MFLHKLLNILKVVGTELYVLFIPIKSKNHIQMPYFSQWEDKKIVKDIILKKKNAKEDKSWKSSGANSREEYEFWSWNMCGMACLKMVLKKRNNKDFPLIDLGKKALEYGSYKIRKEDIDGLFYQPFCVFVRKEFNLKVDYLPFLSLKRVLYEISRGNFVIISVSPLIRYAHKTKSEKIKPGGHLVVVTGYDKKSKTISINNPSGFYKESQENFKLSFKDFEKYFAHRGIIIKK